MPHATLRFYAELNDFLPPQDRHGDVERRFNVHPSIKDLIEAAGVPHTEVDLLLVNGTSVDFACPVRDGDRVSVYPIFESIDITAATKVRPEPLRELRFILDVHLGRLARYLRLAGFDAVYRNDLDAAELAGTAAGGRVLLTRNQGLLKRPGGDTRLLAPNNVASRAVDRSTAPIRPLGGGPAVLPVPPLQ